MALTQTLLFGAIGVMGMFDPASIAMIVLAAIVVPSCRPARTCVLDAFRREILPDNEQGLGAAVFVNATRWPNLVPGACL